MIKLYIKQAFYQLRENRLISLVSIIGTALAICMIMVIVLVLEVRITDCVPEVNRSRSLYMKAMSIHQKGDTSDNSSNGCMSSVDEISSNYSVADTTAEKVEYEAMAAADSAANGGSYTTDI